ncbi:ribbon-helix-helix protein, CopG family [Candidatus Pacearchaeota archaeon]|nr:ribbon-helix-helix protein, CopG family [Candidatus Pacearchaeota archaeon]
MITTIQLEESTKAKLDKLKVHERESYNEVIRRMVEECRNIKVDEESLKETIDILSDPETLRDIAEALNEYEQKKFIELK